MSLFTGIAAVTALSVASLSLAEESAARADVRQVVASASALHVSGEGVARDGGVAQQAKLDEYAGRYETASGAAFVIVREGDSLTIDLPAGFGFESSRLHADESGDFFVAQVAVLVSFESDRDGRVVGVTVYPPDAQAAISAAKAPARRGVVRIYDIGDVGEPVTIAAAKMPARRGVVRIYDIGDAVEPVTIAAAD